MKPVLLFGWAFVMYACMFFLWWLLQIYGLADTQAVVPSGVCLLVVLSLMAGLSLRMRSALDVLPYSACWAMLLALFDALLSVPIYGIGAMMDWRLWAGYLIVVVVPLAAPALREASVSRGMSPGA